MLSRILPILLLATSCLAGEKQIRVAVIDTGLDLKDPRFTHLCPTGHKNFVTDTTLNDFDGHGTHVAGLIQQYAGKANYCLLIYKYYADWVPGSVRLKNEVDAIREAVANGADIVNFSGGGSEFDEDESLAIKYHPEVTFVVAAGNEKSDLDVQGNEFYPASLFYGNMEVVGNINRDGTRATSSNYGKKVENKEVGMNVLSYLPNNRYGYMSGTSSSTAIFTGKLVDRLSKQCDSGVNNASKH